MNLPSTVKLKKQNEICANFAFALQTAKFMATVHGKCLR